MVGAGGEWAGRGVHLQKPSCVRARGLPRELQAAAVVVARGVYMGVGVVGDRGKAIRE